MQRVKIIKGYQWILGKLKRLRNKKSKTVEIETIRAPKGKKYLSEFLTKLPSNTFINKATTGVGATTMALESKEKFIVAVPYQSLANNKKEWCDLRNIDVLVVKQGVTSEDIADFKGDKIIVVFDSLWKLTKYLTDRKSFRLMVDEVHVVLTSATFRGKGMNTILNHFKEFKDFVLITATPTKELYGLDDFKDIKRVNIEWPDKEKINFVRDIVTKDDDYTVADKLILISREHLIGKTNAYFFVNSVQIITKVVKALIKLKLVSANDVNLIVAESNIAKIKVNLGIKYSIGKPPAELDTPKKLNFITSTAFEGSDFYDKNGKIYIVSDGSKSHTKIDILTQLHQIAGRIRNSNLNQSIQIITVPSLILESSNKKDFKAKIEDSFRADEKILMAQQKLIDEEKDNKTFVERLTLRMFREAENNPHYIIDHEGYVRVNKLYIPSQLHSWDVLHQSYAYRLGNKGGKELTDNNTEGIEFIDRKIELPPAAFGKALLGKNYNFRDLAIKYLKARKDEDLIPLMDKLNDPKWEEKCLSKQIGNLVPVLHEAHRILGAQGIINLNYSKTAIKKAITTKASINAIAKCLKIKKGWYSNVEIKEKLQKVYDKTGHNLKAKAVDICKFYIVKDRKKMVGGKRINGFEVKKQIIKVKKQ